MADMSQLCTVRGIPWGVQSPSRSASALGWLKAVVAGVYRYYPLCSCDRVDNSSVYSKCQLALGRAKPWSLGASAPPLGPPFSASLPRLMASAALLQWFKQCSNTTSIAGSGAPTLQQSKHLLTGGVVWLSGGGCYLALSCRVLQGGCRYTPEVNQKQLSMQEQASLSPLHLLG